MILISSLYRCAAHARQQEIDWSFTRNVSSGVFNRIHLFISRDDLVFFLNRGGLVAEALRFGGVQVLLSDTQPTYKTLLSYVATQQDEICAIANSDIEVSATVDFIKLISELLRGRRAALFLSREECDGSMPQIVQYRGSHDCFVFHSGSVRSINDDFSTLNYKQNTLGIEALLIKFFDLHGFKLWNPCFNIRAIHHHASNDRPWQSEGLRAVGYVHPLPLNYPGVHCDVLVKPMKLV